VSFSGTNFTYTPDANYYGSDEFEVTASAEGVSASAKVSLTINSINDVPTISLSFSETDGSDYPLKFVSSGLDLNIDINDVETSLESLSVSATYTFVGSQQTTGLNLNSGSDNTYTGVDFSGISNSGPLVLEISVSDGEASVSETINLWRAKPISSGSDDTIYNLYGDSNDTNRGFRYALVTDSMPSDELQLAVRDSFKFYFREFLSESDEMSQMIVDIFNVIVIEPPLNTSPINVTINSEADCNEGGDPNVFCILQIKPRLFEYVNKFFAPNYFDNFSIVTGKEGRGVNGGNANIQHIATTENGICGQFYCRGPRAMLKTFKHEFGHGYMETGDGYITDFTATNDDGTPTYPATYFENFRYSQDHWVNTTYSQNPQNYKWKHKIQDLNNIPSDANSSDTSNEAIGSWQGCYSHDTFCFRSSYNSIMNGDYGGAGDFYETGERTSVTYFDPVDREAFIIKSWIQQGLHDISGSFSSNGDLVVSHQLTLNSDRYEIRWYVNGAEQTGSKNLSSLTVPDDDSFISVAYRVHYVDGVEGHVTVPDEINSYGDAYNGTFTSVNGAWYCDDHRDVSDLWADIGIRTYCETTQLISFKNGVSSTWPGYGTTFDAIKARGDVKYMYEYSARGAQLVIDLSEY
jgi:hypothetical protein